MVILTLKVQIYTSMSVTVSAGGGHSLENTYEEKTVALKLFELSANLF